MKLYFLFTVLLFRQFYPQYRFTYPMVRRDESIVEEYFGSINITDPYRWLEDLDSPETQDFIRAQNALTIPYMNQCQNRENIKNSLKKLFNYTSFGNLKKVNGLYFYTMRTGLENQRSLYLQETLTSTAKLLVDVNALSETGTISMSNFYPSKNGNLVAYQLTHKGSDWISIHILDVKSGEHLNDTLPRVKFTEINWDHDGNGFFYSRLPDLENRTLETLETGADLNQKVFYHRIGTDYEDDILMAAFPGHPEWSCFAQISHDGDYLLVFTEKDLGPVQIYYISLKLYFASDMQNAKPTLLPVTSDFLGEFSYVTNIGSNFIFRTNFNSPNGSLVRIDIYRPHQVNWKVLVKESPYILDWVGVVAGNVLLLSYVKDVKTSIEIRTLEGDETRVKDLITMEPGYVWPFVTEKNQTELFYSYESILTPSAIYRLDFSKDPNHPTSHLFAKSIVPGFDAKDYILKQEFYTSKDGTRIPMFIAHKSTLQYNETTPCILYGYGGFNSISYPYFSTDQALWLKHFNGIYALANIRGGGEYGHNWYNGGRLLKKQNSFDDFQAAAEYLIEKGYTSSKMLTIDGSSNGGLLVAACVNQRPELYGAAIAHVGVMDMIRFHKFTIGYAWVSDYGNPENQTVFEYILSYSPLHNVRIPEDNETQYPAFLLLTADHDDRVVPSHSYKLISELQYVLGKSKHQTNPLFLKVETDTGHGSGKSISKATDELTDKFAFLCRALDLEFYNGDEELIEHHHPNSENDVEIDL